MNVNPGGAQPKMRDTYWDSRLQKMVYRDGTPKGMKAVLQERGVNVTKMKGDEMRQILQNMADFKYEKTKVEHVLLDSGYKAYFIPKFHCELNPIEMVWGQAKKYTRANCNYSFTGLEANLDAAFDSVTLDSIHKYFRKMRDYLAAYREGGKGLKKYKSHRKVSDTD